MNFTKQSIAQLKPKASRYYVYDDREPALGVTVLPSGKTTFHARVYVYSASGAGATKRITLGPTDALPIPEARNSATELKQMAVRGEDPISSRNATLNQQAMESATVEELLLTYLKEKRRADGKPLKESTAKSYVKDVHKLLGKYYTRPILELTPARFESLMRDRLKESVARASGGARSLNAMWRWWRKKRDFRAWMPESPVTDYVDEYDRLPVVQARAGYLEPAYLAEWFELVEALKRPEQTEYFLMLILSGIRAGEASGLDWSRVDLRAGNFEVIDPKNRRDARIPIPLTLLERFKARAQKKGPVFGDCKESYRRQRREIEATLGVDAYPHLLRRSFVTYGHAARVDSAVVSRLSQHTISGITDQYNQLPLHELAPEQHRIEAHICELAGRTVPTKGNVVAFGGAA